MNWVIHPIQTGLVRVKLAQMSGVGAGVMRLAHVLFDRGWSDWVPILAWLIEHEENGIPKGFLAQYARHKQRPVTFKQTQYLLARVMPILGPKRLTDITRSDITEVLDAVASKGAVHQARTIQVRLATVFNWAYREDLIEANPMRKIAHDRHGKATVRDRVLSAMRELNYRPNSVARALVTGRSNTLGVVTFDTTLYGPATTLYGVA